jgi:heme/copper-type cytochrome/quinol oxidase subunit 2
MKKIFVFMVLLVFIASCQIQRAEIAISEHRFQQISNVAFIVGTILLAITLFVFAFLFCTIIDWLLKIKHPNKLNDPLDEKP